MSATMSDQSSSYGSAGGGDRLAWYFFRLSGVVLLVLALGHMWITHYANVPTETTFEFVRNRWANPLWRAFDWMLLLMALWHGILGLRVVATDLVRKPGMQVLVSSILWITGIAFTILGTITIVTFDADLSLANNGPLADQMWIADALGWALIVIAAVTYVAIAALVIWVVKNLLAGRKPIYAGDTGQYAWVLHRATGVGIVGFLLVHILDIMLIGFGSELYDHAVSFYANPFIIPMEVALVGAVLYHAFNGVRIILIDFWSKGTHKERQMFWIALIGAILVTIPSGILILMHEF
jgi:succinate dehydrogenase cytochrome b556 subunit